MADALPYAFHDNRLQPIGEVAISPLDRGFLFGDGVYEVIPVYAGKPFGMARHLRRLKRSLSEIALPPPLDDNALQVALQSVIDANGGGDLALYLQISRSGDRGRDHRFPDAQAGSLFAMCSALARVDERSYAAGFSAITSADERWARCDIKATSLLANVLARQSASQADAVEAILTRNGMMIEGSASAVLCVLDGVLCAPPETPALLPSITREIVMELAAAENVATRLQDIPLTRFRKADEILLLSSTKELLPVVRLDGETVGTGKPGPVWRKLFRAYQACKVAT